MASVLAWLDHDSRAQEATLRLLALFREKESRDELGIGAIRDSIAEQLFPGTSTIQTRLRYMLFVPWLYQSLEEKRIPAKNFARQADLLERKLLAHLHTAEDSSGAFGKHSGNNLKRLPSTVYWAGLGRWGIRLGDASQESYHQHIDVFYQQRQRIAHKEKTERDRGDDVDFNLRNAACFWHPGLPCPPEEFPEISSFTLTRDEALFIRDQIRLNCEGSLLAWLALNGKTVDATLPWAHPDFQQFPAPIRELLHHARLFSEIVHVAALSYNLQLAEKKNNSELIDAYRQRFNQWQASAPLKEIRGWNINHFWQQVERPGYTITLKTRLFIEKLIQQILRSPDSLITGDGRKLIQTREMALKGVRSRFTNPRALEQWGGHAGTGRLIYRWNNARILLKDLYAGIEAQDNVKP